MYEEEAEQADDEQSEQPIETATEPETTLVSEQEDWRQRWDNFKYINPRFWLREILEGIYQPCLTLQADWRKFLENW